jgi:hypothetical protein
VKRKTLDQLESRKQDIASRLKEAEGGMKPRGDGPEFSAPRAHYEISERVHATSFGGIGAVHNLVRSLGLPELIDEWLPLLKQFRPYHESDHVLNIAYNFLCGGRVLDDLELLRNDAAYLDALGARAIPDPTTAGDFCRRFTTEDVGTLMGIINDARLRVWRQRGAALLEQQAVIDVDSTIVETTGECHEGMDMSYKGIWGYHPLLVSLANTSEPLFVINRSGNRPSSEGAAGAIDDAVDLCRRAGFERVLVRGDTAFSTTAHFDRWTNDEVRFVFGYIASGTLKERADAIPEAEYEDLVRKAERALADAESKTRAKKARAKQPRVKQGIVRERGYHNIKLESEQIAEFEHKPGRAKKSYRMIVLRKNLIEERGQLCLGTNVRYFFYVTNDPDLTAEQVVFHANERCNQENLIAQLKSGVNSLRGPLNKFAANWALMVMASLAWSLKAWLALSLPSSPEHAAADVDAEADADADAERNQILRMEFRTFVRNFMLVPTQILYKGRQLIYRALAWRRGLSFMFRAAECST